jgi:purine-binding chemotaxis protein CheW
VLEVMRPLPVVPIAAAPACVLGMCVMRGQPVAVVDAGALLVGQACDPTRFVATRAGERRIALAVDAVLGTVDLEEGRAAELPSLLDGASTAVAAVAALDRQFLLLLQTARILPDFSLPELPSHARSQ